MFLLYCPINGAEFILETFDILLNGKKNKLETVEYTFHMLSGC